MKEWLDTSPVSSIIGIVIILVAVVLAFNIIKSLAKPIFFGIIIIAAVLIIFNVIDIAFIASTGQKFLSFIWDKITGAAVDAATNALSSTDLPALR